MADWRLSHSVICNVYFNGFIKSGNVFFWSMAIFEQKLAKKVLLDDTEALKCVIENYHNINGHTVGYLHSTCYQVRNTLFFL